LQRIVRSIVYHRGTPETPLFHYYEQHPTQGQQGFLPIKSSELTKALRLAASHVFASTGIPPHRINSRSLRAGGATALLCAGVDKDTVKILGHWRSDSVEVYLRTSSFTVTDGYAQKMLDSGNYQFCAPGEGDSNADGFPEILPDKGLDESTQQLYLDALLKEDHFFAHAEA
jgi:hypothetical protein